MTNTCRYGKRSPWKLQNRAMVARRQIPYLFVPPMGRSMWSSRDRRVVEQSQPVLVDSVSASEGSLVQVGISGGKWRCPSRSNIFFRIQSQWVVTLTNWWNCKNQELRLDSWTLMCRNAKLWKIGRIPLSVICTGPVVATENFFRTATGRCRNKILWKHFPVQTVRIEDIESEVGGTVDWGAFYPCSVANAERRTTVVEFLAWEKNCVSFLKTHCCQ